MKTKIYTLLDPRTGERKYVGRTVQSLAQRLRQHVNDARKKTNKRVAWVRELLALGLRPLIVLVDEVPEGMGKAAEIDWTLKLMAEGCDLVNDGIGRGGCEHPKKIVAWTDELDALLGTIADSIIAEKIGTTRKTVTYRREKLGIPASFDRTRNTPPPPMAGHNRIELPDHIVARLGQAPDYVLGNEIGVAKTVIARARKEHGIKPYAETTGRNGQYKDGNFPARWLTH
jgi:hypothetical protein